MNHHQLILDHFLSSYQAVSSSAAVDCEGAGVGTMSPQSKRAKWSHLLTSLQQSLRFLHELQGTLRPISMTFLRMFVM